MTGIAGFFGNSQARDSAAYIDALSIILRHRGHIEHIGNDDVFLASFQLPSKDDSGLFTAYDHTICADALLYNRPELIHKLNIEDDSLSDAALILFAFLRWGVDCPKHLVGDFSFAIFDQANYRLYCARDVFGVRPFYYATKPNFFFASEAKALQVQYSEINDKYVIDFLLGEINTRQATIFSNIHRLLPGHYMLVEPAGQKLVRYWSPHDIHVVSQLTFEDYVQGFFEVFKQSIQSRIDRISGFSVALSGGLDSTAVLAMLSTLSDNPIPAYTAVFLETPSADESDYIKPLIKPLNIDWRPFNASQLNSVVPEILDHFDDLLIAPNIVFNWEIARQSQAAGLLYKFDGLDGDTILSHGLTYLTELARDEQWQDFDQHIHQVERVRQIKSTSTTTAWWYRRRALPLLTEHIALLKWGAAVRLMRRLNEKTELSYTQMIRNPVVFPGVKQMLRRFIRPPQPLPVFADNFIQRNRLYLLRRQLEGRYPIPILNTFDEIVHYGLSPLIQYMFEIVSQSSGFHGVTTMHPFSDIRVLEYSLSLPGEAKLHNGHGRSVLREAMTGILPDIVRLRGTKSDLSPRFHHRFHEVERQWMWDIAQQKETGLERFLNMNVLSDWNQRVQDKKDHDLNYKLQRALYFAVWLNRKGL